MKTVRHLMIYINVLVLPAVRHVSAQAQPDPYDLFRFGEIYETMYSNTYHQAIADQIAEKYEEHLQFIKKLGAPEKVVSAIQAYKDGATKLPWKQPYSEWSETDKKTWQAMKINRGPLDEWFQTLNDHGFNFWLGVISMDTVYAIGQDVLDRNVSISSESNNIRKQGTSSKNLLTDASYTVGRSKANPAVLEALKPIASISGKLDDAFGGELTTADITALRDAGLQLRSLAKDKKLVK